MNQSYKEVAAMAARAADDKKARDILMLDIHDISVISDYFIICSGNTAVQVQAIADNIVEKLKEKGITPLRQEGVREGRWILLDYGYLVAHVFKEDEREYYNLERLWGDAPVVEYSLG